MPPPCALRPFAPCALTLPMRRAMLSPAQDERDKVGESAMSEEPVCAQKGPYQVTLDAGKAYFWCACGRSARQPFCDGSHKTTSFAAASLRGRCLGHLQPVRLQEHRRQALLRRHPQYALTRSAPLDARSRSARRNGSPGPRGSGRMRGPALVLQLLAHRRQVAARGLQRRQDAIGRLAARRGGGPCQRRSQPRGAVGQHGPLELGKRPAHAAGDPVAEHLDAWSRGCGGSRARHLRRAGLPPRSRGAWPTPRPASSTRST